MVDGDIQIDVPVTHSKTNNLSVFQRSSIHISVNKICDIPIQAL